jgi:cystathionine beta-lyase
MPGANLSCLATTQPGDGVAIHTPVYPPLRRMPLELDRRRVEIEFSRDDSGCATITSEELRRSLDESIRLLLLCNPQNPTGRVFRKSELTEIAEYCLARNIYICSDEIHSDLTHRGAVHTPIASLSREIGERCITLMAPSKTFNIAGLSCAFAVIQNAELRRKFRRASGSLLPHVDILAHRAALEAYRSGEGWLSNVLRQLQSNRDLVTAFVRQELPRVSYVPPEGTYLAWLDCSGAGLPGRPYEFFLREAKVALSDGALFGNSANNHVRLNFGCSEATLREALRRMRDAINRT